MSPALRKRMHFFVKVLHFPARKIICCLATEHRLCYQQLKFIRHVVSGTFINIFIQFIYTLVVCEIKIMMINSITEDSCGQPMKS